MSNVINGNVSLVRQPGYQRLAEPEGEQQGEQQGMAFTFSATVARAARALFSCRDREREGGDACERRQQSVSLPDVEVKINPYTTNYLNSKKTSEAPCERSTPASRIPDLIVVSQGPLTAGDRVRELVDTELDVEENDCELPQVNTEKAPFNDNFRTTRVELDMFRDYGAGMFWDHGADIGGHVFNPTDV